MGQACPNAITTAAPPDSLTLCILDDDPVQIDLLSEHIRGLNHGVVTTADAEEALDLVRTEQCQVLLVDAHLPGLDVDDLLGRALRCNPAAHAALMTGDYTQERALALIRRGATDVLAKPVDGGQLKRVLDEVTARHEGQRCADAIEDQLLAASQFHGLVGKAPAMLDIFDYARRVARHYSNALLTGAAGSGKELLARAIHEASPASGQPFVVGRCSAAGDMPLECRLFGYARGAFPGATDAGPGLFEYANSGTLFLKDAGEIPLRVQARLLRAIEKREFQRTESSEIRPVSVRLIAATSRDLRTEVLAGRFREDLYNRLCAVQIQVPPLAARKEDIPLLARHFLRKYSAAYGKDISGLSRGALAALVRYRWPGNVHELENVIATACVTATRAFLDTGDLPEHFEHCGTADTPGATKQMSLGEVRDAHIRNVLEACGGNRVRAARVLGIGRTSLYRYLRCQGL